VLDEGATILVGLAALVVAVLYLWTWGYEKG